MANGELNMLYLLEVCLLFSIPIVGMAGFVLMTLAVWTKFRDYGARPDSGVTNA